MNDLIAEGREPLTDEELRSAAVHGWISHDASSERQNLWGQFAAHASAELLAARARIAELEAETSLQDSYERYLRYMHGIDEGDYAEFLEWREEGNV